MPRFAVRSVLGSALAVAFTGTGTASAAIFSPAKPVLAGNASGNAVAAAWTEDGDRTLPAPYSGGTPARVVLTVRTPGRGWSRPLPVSDPHVQARDPQLIVDQAGDTLIAWQVYDLDLDTRYGGFRLTTVARWRLADGTLTTPQELTGRSGDNRLQDLVGTPSGTVLAVVRNGTTTQVMTARPGAPFDTPKVVTGLTQYASAAITPSGTLLLAGHGPETGTRVEFMRPDGTITRPVDVAGPGSTQTYTPPAITAAPDGGAVVTWVPTTGPSRGHIGLARFAQDGTLVNQAILPQPASTGRYSVAQTLDPSGVYTLVVNDTPGPELREVTVTPGTAPVDGPSLTSPDGVFYGSIVADFDDTGAGLVAWQTGPGQINAAARPAGGDFARTPTVAAAAAGASLVIRAPAVLQRPATQVIAWDDPGTTAPPGTSTIQALVASNGFTERQTLAAATESPTTWVDPDPHGPHIPQVLSATFSRRSKRVSLRLRCGRTILSCDGTVKPDIGLSHLQTKRLHVAAHTTRTFHFDLHRRARERAGRVREIHLAFTATPRDGYSTRQTVKSPIAIVR